MEIQIAFALVEKCIEVGAPTVKSLLVALNKTTITLEDIEALSITKEPEEF